jgi:hypothetical protein
LREAAFRDGLNQQVWQCRLELSQRTMPMNE